MRRRNQTLKDPEGEAFQEEGTESTSIYKQDYQEVITELKKDIPQEVIVFPTGATPKVILVIIFLYWVVSMI